MNYYALHTNSFHPDHYTNLRMGLARYQIPIRPTGAVDYDMLYKHGRELYTMVTDHDDKQERAAFAEILRDAVHGNSVLLEPLLVFYKLPTLDTLRDDLDDYALSEEEYEALARFRQELPEVCEVMKSWRRSIFGSKTQIKLRAVTLRVSVRRYT